MKLFSKSLKPEEVINFLKENPDFFIDHPEAIEHLAEEELLSMIAKLPDGYKMVFNLYVIEGYSHKEIADLLNIGESTSRSQLVKARKLLKEIIIQYNEIIYEKGEVG